MIIELKIPSPGESINEVEIATWLVSDGDCVEKDQEIAELESDKATLPLIAPESGTVKILVPTGDTVPVDTVACKIDTKSAAKKVKKSKVSQPDLSDTSHAEITTGSVKETKQTEKEVPVATLKSKSDTS